MTMATMEETGVQNYKEGPHEQKKPHNANYTAMEDVIVNHDHGLLQSIRRLNLRCQTERIHFLIQKLNWHTIQSRSNKKQQEEIEEKELLQPSHLRATDTVAMSYPAGTGLSLYQHTQKPFPLQLSS